MRGKQLLISGTALTLGVTTSLTTSVFAAPASTWGCYWVSDEDTLNNCLVGGYETYLYQDVTITSASKNSYGIANAAGAIYIPAGVNPVLNLNNHTIKADSSLAIKVGMINVANGASLTVNGNGTITTNGGPADKPYAAISMTASGDLQDDTKTASLTINGGTIEGYYYGIVGNGSEGRGNTNVTINGGTVRGIATDDSIGIFNPQFNSNVTINGGTVTGDSTGIEMRAGNLTVNGGTIEGRTSTATTSAANDSGNTTKGAGIAIAQHNTKQPIAVSITGGEVKGYTAVYESNPQNNADTDLAKISVSISGGEINAVNGGTKAVNLLDTAKLGKNTVTGGKFSSKPESMTIPTGYAFDENTKQVRALVDLTALDAAIDAAEDKEETSWSWTEWRNVPNYTAASWQNLQTVLTAAKTARTEATDGWKDAMQTYVDQNTSALNNAIAALEGLADKTALQSALNNTWLISLINLNYSEDSFQNLLDARTAGQALIDAEVGATRQQEIADAVAAIEKAVNDRVDLADLRTAIYQANRIADNRQDEVTLDSFAAYHNAIEAAEAVRDDATLIGDEGKQAVADAIAAINTAHDALEDLADLSDLEEWFYAVTDKVNEDEDFVMEPTLEGYYNEAAEKLAAAQNIGETQQEAINTLTNNLMTAFLTQNGNIGAEKGMQEALAAYNELDKDAYTATSMQVATEAKDAILDYILNADVEDLSAEDITADVDPLVDALVKAMDALVEAADTTALEAAIENAETIDETLYTEESFADLTEALEAAKDVLIAAADLSNSEEDQAIVDAAAQALADAIDALVEKPVTPDTGTLTAAEESTASRNFTGLIATVCASLALALISLFAKIKSRKNR